MPITTNIVSSNPSQVKCTRYNIMWLAAGRWFSPGTAVSSINKTDRHDITEILLKKLLNTITLTLILDQNLERNEFEGARMFFYFQLKYCSIDAKQQSIYLPFLQGTLLLLLLMKIFYFLNSTEKSLCVYIKFLCRCIFNPYFWLDGVKYLPVNVPNTLLMPSVCACRNINIH